MMLDDDEGDDDVDDHVHNVGLYREANERQQYGPHPIKMKSSVYTV